MLLRGVFYEKRFRREEERPTSRADVSPHAIAAHSAIVCGLWSVWGRLSRGNPHFYHHSHGTNGASEDYRLRAGTVNGRPYTSSL